MVNYDVTTSNVELSYDVCEKCGSLWLDAGELDKMAFQVKGSIEFSSEEEDAALGKDARKCPRCVDFELARVRFLGETDIVLEHCRNCGGFWLDGGELNLVDRELTKIMPVTGHGCSAFGNNVHLPVRSHGVGKPRRRPGFNAAGGPRPGEGPANGEDGRPGGGGSEAGPDRAETIQAGWYERQPGFNRTPRPAGTPERLAAALALARR